MGVLLSQNVFAETPEVDPHDPNMGRSSADFESDRNNRNFLAPIVDACSNALASMSGRTKMIIGVSALAVLSIPVGIKIHNWDHTEGAWKNLGTEDKPIWMPDVGTELLLKEKIRGGRTLWVHNDKNNFGKVIFREDKIKFVKDDGTIVAETDFVDPHGRPWDEETPLPVNIYDGAGNHIGLLEEYDREDRENQTHTLRFKITDTNGNLVGISDPIVENRSAEPEGEYGITLKDGDGETYGQSDRKGKVTTTYRWDLKKNADPRLLVILTAYKHYVDQVRSDDE